MGGSARKFYKSQISMTCYYNDAAFSGYSSYLLNLFLQVGEKKCHCTKLGLKILRITLSEFPLNNEKWDIKG